MPHVNKLFLENFYWELKNCHSFFNSQLYFSFEIVAEVLKQISQIYNLHIIIYIVPILFACSNLNFFLFTKKKEKKKKAACHFVPLCIHPDLFIFSQLLLTNIFFIKGRSFYNSQIDDPIFDSFLFCMLLENYLGHTLIINFNNFLKSYSLFHFFLKIFLKTYISQTFFLFLFFALFCLNFFFF